ncbi:MAG: phosphoenolpyruvate mutase [Ruminococcus flavefaciens]|nr:phosphoenolpyruvate mutase [Ruminococcus flavefaciens]
MKALILNSGMGTRMGSLTENQPKCMTAVDAGETILSRQLRILADNEITDVVITTGAFADKIEEYCRSLLLPLKFTFVYNPDYKDTNYIYSIFLAADFLQDDDILLLHGDLVFESAVVSGMLETEDSCMAVCSGHELPDKDFKAVIQDGIIGKVGIEFFQDAVTAQPLYKLLAADWKVWLDEISRFCIRGDVKCYAENALNTVSRHMALRPYDVGNALCSEVDTQEDWRDVSERLKKIESRTVYMSFSTDVIHGGHMAIIEKAAALGKLTVGVLTDAAVASYKRFPLIPFEERQTLLKNIRGVCNVVEQTELSYRENLLKLKPDFVVHGTDWREGPQKPIREEVISILDEWGGRLIEFPYTEGKVYEEIEKRMQAELSIPDFRRGRLKKAIQMKGCVTALEVHSGITGLIAEKTAVEQEGRIYQFDAMWVSSLCDSTAKGKPDIELVDMTSRFRTIDDIMEVTTKPIIFDGDTGGLIEHFTYTVKSLERMGVSMIIIEDKVGLKKNSLFGTEVEQTQDSIEHFSAKLAAGKKAKKTNDFMIVARIESLILEKGMEDALTRARAYVAAGADGIMIHSRKKEPDEIFEFVKEFREKDAITPLVVVPTAFPQVTEEEFKTRGVNVVIYANHLTRSGFPAMQNVARSILRNHRAKEADAMCMSIKEIITLIPEEK